MKATTENALLLFEQHQYKAALELYRELLVGGEFSQSVTFNYLSALQAEAMAFAESLISAEDWQTCYFKARVCAVFGNFELCIVACNDTLQKYTLGLLDELKVRLTRFEATCKVSHSDWFVEDLVWLQQAISINKNLKAFLKTLVSNIIAIQNPQLSSSLLAAKSKDIDERIARVIELKLQQLSNLTEFD